MDECAQQRKVRRIPKALECRYSGNRWKEDALTGGYPDKEIRQEVSRGHSTSGNERMNKFEDSQKMEGLKVKRFYNSRQNFS